MVRGPRAGIPSPEAASEAVASCKLDNEVIGAIGAAGAPGGNLDDGCAKAGLEKIRDRLK
jgi:uncharacterized protein GlcG (DUF336 family)